MNISRNCKVLIVKTWTKIPLNYRNIASRLVLHLIIAFVCISAAMWINSIPLGMSNFSPVIRDLYYQTTLVTGFECRTRFFQGVNHCEMPK